MAPKPAKSPKKPTSAKTPKKSEASKKETGFENAAGESDIVVSPPTNKEEALAQMSFDGLPSCNAAEVRTMVGKKYGELVKIFAHYCKFSECTTVEMATRLSLNGFKRLVKDSGLEVKVYNLQQMSRLFNLRGGAKGAALDAEEGTSLGIEQFLTLMVHLAFYRENPRYAPQLSGAPKLTQETVPVGQCVSSLLAEFVPKMRTGGAAQFRALLAGDAEARRVVESYADKVDAWAAALVAKGEETGEEVSRI